MKRMMVVAALACAMLSTGSAWAQKQGSGDQGAQAAPAAAAQPSLQQQIEDLRARLSELESQLAEQRESTSRELYAINDAQSKLATGEKVKISGYVQTQFTSDQAASPGTDFRVRRARIKLDAPVTDVAALTLQVDATRTVELKDAYLDLGRPTDVWRLRFGQAKVPFMYEVLESSGNRLEPERTALATTLFPGERDQGAWVQFKNALGDSIPGTTLDVGLQNGNGVNAADNNNSKDVVARLRFPIGNAPPDKNTEADSVYLAYRNGELTDAKTSVTTDKTFIGGGVSKALGPVWFRGEAITGKQFGHDIFGWYAHGSYEIPGTPGTLFARYERFDENRDKSGDQFNNLTVGYQHQIDSKTTATLAYEFRDPQSGYSKFPRTKGNALTLRMQVKY
jgi:ribosomal protein L9